MTMRSRVPTQASNKLGIIAAPGWFDRTMQEFLLRHAHELDVTQTILPPVGFDYSFEQIRASLPWLERSARLLVEAGAQVIAQVGPAFAYQLGQNPSGAKAVGQQLSSACGVPVVLNGVAVLEALEQLDRRRIAVACPYYNPAWQQEFSGFLQDANYVIDHFGTFVTQGIIATHDLVAARNYRFTDDEVMRSVRQTRADAPLAEVLVIGGSGVRTLHWIESLEQELGIPLVSADRALYRAVLGRLALEPQAH
jgi:maleate cis-trans isomerase